MQNPQAPRLVFPDTTVLINFALVDEMPLLERLVAGNGAWTGTVASECDDQSDKQHLPQMRAAHGIFGDPLVLETPAEWMNFRANQTYFRQASNNPMATHAGESETLAIVTSRGIKSVVVSDDKGVAKRLAVLNVHPVVQATTSWHLFRIAFWKGHLARERFREIRKILLDAGRGCPVEVRDPQTFETWILRPR